jgi:hypothetical protein
MQVRLIGVVGYAVVFPAAAAMVATLFLRKLRATVPPT